MAVSYLGLSAVSTVASLVGLQWWVFSAVQEMKSDGLIKDGDGIAGSESFLRVLELLLNSHVTVAVLANFAINVFVLFVLLLKTLFFFQLNAFETRKVLERSINYIVYKGTFLPLVVPSNLAETVIWSAWLIVLCSFKMFLSLARDRIERLNASPVATVSSFFRVYSAVLSVLVADLLWVKVCITIYGSFSSSLFLLLFFEPLSIAFEALQVIMVQGFQLLEICERNPNDGSPDFLGSNFYKKAAGSLSECKGILIRHCGFFLDMMALMMALGHFLTTWWLHGMTFHLVDAVLLIYSRAILSAIVKRVRTYIKLRKALSSLDGALPDATYEELCAYNDECAICREPMARAKKLSCRHIFHLACLRSWLDQGLTEVYSCPTCRRPLFLSNSQPNSNSTGGNATNDQQLVDHLNLGLNQHRVSDHAQPADSVPDQQQDPARIWSRRGSSFDSGWVSPWTNQGDEGASTSSAIRSAGFSGVQLMMRQLASVSENYAHGSLDDSWNPWTSQHASGSSNAPYPSSLRVNRSTAGIRFRNTTPVNGNMSEILAMVDRVREVLPHIPDELIIQDLLRTNNINITVNNLLLV